MLYQGYLCQKIYLHLINIYKVSKKNLLANETFKIVTKEFFNDIAVWKAYIEFLFESQVDDPKIALDKSMQVLNKKQHLPMTLHYAGCLYKFGKCEEARNLFDEVLKSLPKRKDIWFVYCDKETKYGNVDKARKIYERMIEVDFKRNALKSVMKKYLTFEKENSANDAQFKKLLSGLLASQSDGENDVDSDDPANKVHCPKCGMSYAEFIENSVFGCPDCYDVFGPLISDTIRKIQGSDRHTGKKPLIYGNYDNSFAHLGDADDDSGMEISKEIDVLQKRLKEAVLLEDFDLAANLRDQISELKKGLE